MPLYDEIDLDAGTAKVRVKECSLRKNEKMNLYWRMVAGLHELGHTISKFPLCSGSRKKSRIQISEPIVVMADDDEESASHAETNKTTIVY